MIITRSNYNNSDREYQDICKFLNRLSVIDPMMLWESGRMNFWRYNVHADKKSDDIFFTENVQLWHSDNHEIVGLCISEYGRNDLFIEVLPEFHYIYPQIFRWINNTWAVNRNEIEIDIFGADNRKIDWLQKHGFSFKCHYENKRTYDLESIDLSYKLGADFRVQTFSELADYSGRVALVQSAFSNPGYSEQKLRGMMASPDYIDDYHLVVVSPGQLQVAYCVGWHENADNQRGYIEPVGTHADWRQRGFAKAVIKECFQRMKLNDIRWVEIASSAEPDISNFLYNSLSPYQKREVHRYLRKIS